MDIKKEDIKQLFFATTNSKSERVNNILKIIIKSLVDEKDEGRVVIDYKKLRNELTYFKYYDVREDGFSYFFMYIPIIISNKRFDSGLMECLKLAKNLFGWMGESKVYISVFKAFVFFSIYRYMLEMDEPEYAACLTRVKEEIIKFNPKVEKVDFVNLQKFRIKLLDRIFKANKREFILDEDDLFFDFDRLFLIVESVFYGGDHGFNEPENVIKNFLNAVLDIIGSRMGEEDVAESPMKKEFKTEETITKDSIAKDSITKENKSDLLEIYTNSETDRSYDSNFFKKSADYLIKLRYGMVGIKHNEALVNPIYLLDKKVGDELLDPVFNNIVIEKNDGRTVTIISKTGRYTLDFTEER